MRWPRCWEAKTRGEDTAPWAGRLRPGREESKKTQTSPRSDELQEGLLAPEESSRRAHGGREGTAVSEFCRSFLSFLSLVCRLSLEGHHWCQPVTREKVKEKSHCPAAVAFLWKKNNAFGNVSSPLIWKMLQKDFHSYLGGS